jgi:hypothetical protein
MERSEKELDQALAAALESNPALVAWILARTKFAGRNLEFHSCRSNHPWGAHPFTSLNRDTGEVEKTRRQSETDVLLLLKNEQDRIVGIHFENKLGSGVFTELQPEMYPQRAAHWVGNPKYGNYEDFDTVLLAPSSFQIRNKEQAAAFGCFVSHEEITQFVPEFGDDK